MNRIKQLMVVIACCSPLAVAAHPGHSAPTAAVTPLISKAFANIPGKEGLMVVVDYAPGAVAVTKEIALATRHLPRQDMLEFSARGFARCMLSEEGREGVASFLEKRKPVWAE